MNWNIFVLTLPGKQKKNLPTLKEHPRKQMLWVGLLSLRLPVTTEDSNYNMKIYFCKSSDYTHTHAHTYTLQHCIHVLMCTIWSPFCSFSHQTGVENAVPRWGKNSKLVLVSLLLTGLLLAALLVAGYYLKTHRKNSKGVRLVSTLEVIWCTLIA